MTVIDIPSIAAGLSASEQLALKALPVPDYGNMEEEAWWLFYSLLDQGLLTGGHDNYMRRTELGEQVLQHIKSASR